MSLINSCYKYFDCFGECLYNAALKSLVFDLDYFAGTGEEGIVLQSKY